MFGIGLVFFAIGYAGLGLTTDPVTAWLLIGVYGLFTGCTDGVGKAWISSLVGADLQASAQGVFQGAQRFRGAGGGIVGRVPVGRRRQTAAAGLRDRRRSVRGGAAGVAVVTLQDGTANSTSSSANGGAPTPTTE